MRTLSKDKYEELLAQSEIMEQDRYGIKVIRMPDGNFLKTFWFRRVVSSRRIYPEAYRFSLNAKALHRRAVPTVKVIKRIQIPHLKRTGVIYRPLAGRTLRQVAKAGEFNDELAEQLGAFVAVLHRQGVFFRALHLGNVLLCPDGTLGLIDISDLTAYPWALGQRACLRNFYHLFRYPEDSQVLSDAGISAFMDGYAKEKFCPRMQRRMRRKIKRWVAE
ncbi:MAG: hypothetical protein WC334_03065 [Kiritimatiellales bacterium]